MFYNIFEQQMQKRCKEQKTKKQRNQNFSQRGFMQYVKNYLFELLFFAFLRCSVCQTNIVFYIVFEQKLQNRCKVPQKTKETKKPKTLRKEVFCNT